ncbi:MAG: hypothetical protein WC477_07315 [Patescibacteria group bacterium]
MRMNKDPLEIHWEHANFSNGQCDISGCKNQVTHRLFDEYGADGLDLSSRCDEHYNKETQRKRLQRMRKKMANI